MNGDGDERNISADAKFPTNSDAEDHPTHTISVTQAPPTTDAPSSTLSEQAQSEETPAITPSQQENKDLKLPPAQVAPESGGGEDENSEALPAETAAAIQTGEDSQEWVPDGDHEMKRVKVYELIGSRWVDQGTAFCFGQFQEETNEALLIARSEANYQEVILSTAIRSNDVYQRQQDTLIVWTEPDGVDYALSFQDPEGCSEVWNFILEVQRHMNCGDQIGLRSSPQIGPEPASVTTASIIRSGHLPQPQLGIIGEIERAIKTLSRTQTYKERICEYIQQEDYIKALIEVMNQAEDLESLENLHALCNMMQTILMLNDHSMYEHILEDDIFFGVVGMLEYDPEFPTHKANYRQFLHQTSRFRQPIPIQDESVQRKIHHTYRLQFLKDVVLARALDDSTFNVLNSCIIFNQIDIITHVQNDPSFLRDVVRLYVDEDMLSGGGVRKKDGGEPKSDSMDVDSGPSSDAQPNGAPRSAAYAYAPPDELAPADVTLRCDVVLLLQQLCVMGKNVQLPARMALFRALVDRGVLFAVQWALALPERDADSRPLIAAGGEILTALLDHDLNGVRGHVLKQVAAIEKEREAGKKGADRAETVLALVCRMLAQSRDLALQSQFGDALKVLLDIPPPDGPEPQTPGAAAVRLLGRGKDDPGTEKFLDFFYKHCIETLLKPFDDIPEFKALSEPVLPLTREKTNLYVYLCELLCNFALQHSFRSHFYMLSSNIAVRIASLLRARDKHLRHAAFRFFRMCLKLNNRNLQNHLVKHGVFKPLLDLTIQESRRDNLLSSSCQEFFESVRRDNVKDIIQLCMTKHEAEIRTLAESPLGGKRFTMFIQRWEMNNEPLPPEEAKPDKTPDGRQWPSQARLIELEEEDYFNGDDDDDDSYVPAIASQWVQTQTSSLANQKRKRRAAVTSDTRGYRPPNLAALRVPSIAGLVDYGDDDDDDTDLGPLGTINEEPPDSSVSSPASKKDSLPGSPTVIRIPSSPKPIHRQVPSPAATPPRRAADDDEEDNILEALVRGKSGPPSPAPSVLSFPPLGGIRPGEKRRREEEDDGLLERLSRPKKQDLGPGKEGLVKPKTNAPDEPPKRIKLKFGVAGLGVAPATLPSETGAKDGDIG